LLAAALVVLLILPSPAQAAPANDDLANAVDLSGFNPETGNVEGVNVNATKEVGEPDHAGNVGGRSVWYTWDAPADGSVPHVGFSTLFSDFDTLLAVYTGATVVALAEVASNDDSPGLAGGSAVSFLTTPGTTYRIAVDGFQGKAGHFFLAWHEAPPNDNFADAVALPGTAAGTRGGDNSSGATAEPGEQIPATPTSVWYSWTPPADGTYKLSTLGSRFDTVLAVYTGSSLENLQLLVQNDDDPERGCCSSWIPLVDADSATTYMIQITSLSEDGGPLRLNWGPLILGDGAANTIVGTAGAEEIRGRGGNDDVRGRGGNDLVFGGRGNDVLRGGAGADLVFDHFGVDLLFGQAGVDRIDARDRRAGDTLFGGTGADVCRADRGDVRNTC
jgi:Ca2+-binding RTX toxin-like protein